MIKWMANNSKIISMTHIYYAITFIAIKLYNYNALRLF